jgi:hypothetical protein
MSQPTFSLDEDNLTIRWAHDCTATRPTGDPVGSIEHELPIGMMTWMVQSNDPLTVVPEIFCFECGLTGSIIDGEWVKS